MPTIDELNFKVIINDEDFNKKISKDLEEAEKLNTKLSSLLDLRNRLSQAVTKSSNAETKAANATMKAAISQEKLAEQQAKTAAALATQAAAEERRASQKKVNDNRELEALANKERAEEKLNQTREKATRHIKSQTKELQVQSGVMSQLSSYITRYLSVMGAERFLSKLVDITGEFEVQQKALRVMIGDIEKADTLFEELRQFAVESPYTFQELAQYTKQLSAFDIPTDKLLETNKMLADVAAGLGVSMDRLILAYGHVKSSGFLRGMQLRSFTQNGVPILKELSAILSEVEDKAISTGEVFDKMSKREIPFEYVEEAFKRMTSEGGKFYKMQETLVETLQGRIAKLRDVYQQALFDLGSANSGTLKSAVDVLIKIVRHLDAIVKVIVPVVAGFGAYAAVLGTVMMAQKAMMAVKFVQFWIQMTKGVGAAKAAVVAYGEAAVKAQGITTLLATSTAALAGVFAALGVGLYEVYNHFNKTAKAQRELAAQVASTGESFTLQYEKAKKLLEQMEKLEVGTKAYDKARQQLMDNFGEYLSDVDKEKIAVGELSDVYASLATNIDTAAKNKMIRTAYETAEQNFMSASESIFQKVIKSYQPTPEMETELMKYVFDNASVDDLPLLKEQRDKQGEFTSMFMNALVQARGQIEEARKEYEDARRRAELKAEAFSVLKEDNIKKEQEEDLKGWRGMVNETLSKLDSKIVKSAKLAIGEEDNDYFNYLERIGKEWKEISEQKDKALKVDKPHYQAMLDAIKVVDKALEGNILSDVRYTKTPWNGTDDSAKKQTQMLKEQADALMKLKNSYDKLSDTKFGQSDSQIKDIMKKAFPEEFHQLIDEGDYENKILSLIETIRGFDPKAAMDIAEALGMDGISLAIKQFNEQLKESKEAEERLKKYRDAIEKWRDSIVDTTLEDYDLSKIIGEYNTAITQIDDKMLEAMNDAEQLGETALEAEEIADRARSTTYNKMNDQLKDFFTGKYVKEQLEKNGLELSDWGDKSIKQVKDIYNELMRLAGESPEFNEELQAMADKAGVSIDDFVKLAQALFKKYAENADEELNKKFGDVIANVTKLVGELGGALQDLGEASGNNTLSVVGEGLSELSGIVGNAAQSFLKGDILGGFTAIVSGIGKGIISIFTEAAELKNKLAELRDEARKDNLIDSITDGVDNIFGTSEMRKVQNAIKVVNGLKGDLQSMAAPDIVKITKGFWKAWMTTPEPVKTSLKDLAQSIGRSLYDESGIFDRTTLETILDTYPRLDKATKEWISTTLNSLDAYDEAMSVVKDSMNDLFGNIAEDAASKIVDSWLDAGNAALDYADILDDVARSYAKMVIKFAIMDNFFNEQTAKEVADRFMHGDSAGAMEDIAQALGAVADSAPMFEQILTAFEPYFNRDSTSSSSISESIKNISEEQAGLLSSYINAMRGDLSAMRIMATEGWQNVRSILDMMPSPTIWDSITAIEANTYDMMQSNRSILSEMRSVIGSVGTGGATSLKVEVVS